MKDYQTIHFDGQEITVTRAGYEQIQAIIAAQAICQTCKEHYTSERPNVALNCCLSCYLQMHPDASYIREEPKGSFLFLATTGYIHYSHSHQRPGEYPKGETCTLEYWGYPFPKSAADFGASAGFAIWRYKFYMYGRPGTDAVMVLAYTYYDNREQPEEGTKREYIFLSTRHGALTLLDRHQKATRELFKQARARAEATKDDEGYYHFENGPQSWMQESNLYPIIAQIKSEEHAAAHPQQESAPASEE
jgi:hypothetical protein